MSSIGNIASLSPTLDHQTTLLSNASTEPDFLLIGLFLVIFVWRWHVLCFHIAENGGWNTLAKQYSSNIPFLGKRFRFKSGRISAQGSYGNCLTLGANKEGLYIAVMFPFIKHAPLVIPWSDLTAHESKKRYFFTSIGLEFSKSPGNTFQFPKSLIEKVSKESGGQLNLRIPFYI